MISRGAGGAPDAAALPLGSSPPGRLEAARRLGVDFRRVRTFTPLGQARLHAALAYGFLHR